MATIGGREYRVERLSNTRVHEFLVYTGLTDLMRTPLPEAFKLIFDECLWDRATVREASPCQRTWVVAVEREQSGRVTLTGAWRDFLLHYQIDPCSFLLFRFTEGTSDFVIKVFYGGCRVHYPPDPAARR